MNRIGYVAVLLAGLVYTNALDNPFVYDDHRLILENRSLLNPTDVRGLLLHESTRPVMNLSYAIDRTLWGPEPFGFHLTSVGLHMLNVALVFLLVRRVMNDRGDRGDQPPSIGPDSDESRPDTAAGVAALLFAVHPMMTQSVGYIGARSEVLCATWLLLALLAARRWMRGGRASWLLITGGLWLVAMVTKETAAVFPIALFLFDRLLCPDTPAEHRRRLRWMHLPVLAVATVAVAARLAVLVLLESAGAPRPEWSLALVELDVLRRYLSLMIMPTGQSIFQAVSPVSGLLDPRVLAGLCLIGLFGAISWRLRKTDGLVGFGLLWFLLLLLPSTALVVLDRGEPMAEHRVYTASIGLFLAVGAAGGWLHGRFARRRPALLLPLGVVFSLWLVLMGGRTVLRNQVWSDPVGLWTEALDAAPDHWLPHLLLGEALQGANRCDEAVPRFRTSLRLHPEETTGYRKIGGCLIELGRLDEARTAFEGLRLRSPYSPHASNGLGVLALADGQSGMARRHFMESLEYDTYNVHARQGLAMLDETVAKDPRAALRWCEEIASIAPETPGNDDCIDRNGIRLTDIAQGQP